jgi:hypothetical protein
MLALGRAVPTRQHVVKTFVAAVIIAVAVVTVGLTASTESPFSISVHTAFLRLGIDLDVKLGSFHLRASWSALPSTKPAADRF